MSKVFNFKAYIVSVLRRASYRNPQRSEALKRARIDRNSYMCTECLKLFPRKGIAIDHKEPVVRTTGWVSFDDFITRLFCGVDGLQVLCKEDHKRKTQVENKLRRENAKASKLPLS